MNTRTETLDNTPTEFIRIKIRSSQDMHLNFSKWRQGSTGNLRNGRRRNTWLNFLKRVTEIQVSD